MSTKSRLAVAAVVLCLMAGGIAGAVVFRPDWLPAGLKRVVAGQNAGRAGKGADAGLFCKEHGVPEAFCTLCHDELKGKLLLCKEHGDIPEDICTLCHPEVEQTHKLIMCPKGHGLPKWFCNQCGNAPSASASPPDDGWCVVHNQPEATCAACADKTSATGKKSVVDSAKGQPGRVCRQPLPIVRLASKGLAQRIGITTAPAIEETHAHRLQANAETAYDANRYAEVSPRVAGFLREVRTDLGHAVKRGDVLAVVDSAEVSAAKTQLLSAHAAVKLAQVTADRTQSLTRTGVVAGKAELEVLTALNQAQASAMDAEQKLRNLGFEDAQLETILNTKDTRNLLDIVAPIDGAVVARHAVKGEAVQPTSQLFTVADTSRMWLWIDLYENDTAKVSPGQKVVFRISGADPDSDDPTFEGSVTWVGAEVNDKTRTTRIRAELANPRGRLRANQFGQAEIQVGTEHKATLVPKEAVQRKDATDLVFLPTGEPDCFRPQRVVARPSVHADAVEIAWGLAPGQRVVTRGAFLLKTEIMKGAIGAGCCE